MSEPFVPRVGGILSGDIAVPEHEREMRFYSSVLSTGEHPLWREDLMNNLGMPIIGLGERSTEYEMLPLQWMPHIQVADVATSVERALGLGGSELIHGKDGDGKSLWAGLLDPNGAAFGIIPVVSEEEISAHYSVASHNADRPLGRITWFDLTVSDATATSNFYRQVIGWSVQDVDMEDEDEHYADYNMIGDDGNSASGVCHARGMNLGLPPVWMMYLPVSDLTESLRRVREEGGKIIRETKRADGGYGYVIIEDPVGAILALAPG